MDELDRRLRDALRREAGADPGPEPDLDTVRGVLTEVFRTRHRLLTVVSLIKMLVFAALAALAAVMFFAAADHDGRILWGVVFLWASMGLGLVATAHWMMIHRNAVLRELKRLELRIAATAPAPDDATRGAD